MATQPQVISQILSQEYKQQQSRLKQTKEKLLRESQQLKMKIENELVKLNETSQMIIKSATNMTKIYVDSLDKNSSSPNVIDLSILSTYLKKQKLHLSQLISQQSKGQNSRQQSGKQLLHNLSKRKKVEKYYEYLECLRLQKEIEYLERNILLGKDKNGPQTIAYDDIEGVTLKQEQQMKDKMKMLLDQLERVVGLSGQCGGNNDEGLQRKIVSLRQQGKRLQLIEQLVDKERKQIVIVKDFFNTYSPTETIELIQQKIYELENNHHKELPQKKNFFNQLITSEEIKFLLDFEYKNSESIKIYKKPYEEVNELLNSCKAKLKKVKN